MVVRIAAKAEIVPAKAPKMSRIMTALSLAAASERITFSDIRSLKVAALTGSNARAGRRTHSANWIGINYNMHI